MAWTRRGFLGAALALVGEAVFDPIGKLWQARPSLVREVLGLRPLGSVDAAAEFDDLTQEIAKRLGERLTDKQTRILQRVEFSKTLRPGVLQIEGLREDTDRFRFEPAETRTMTTFDPRSTSRREIPDRITSQLLANTGLGMTTIAPIAGELRPGEPFDDETGVALGTCPHTGLVVRVLRFMNDAPGSSGGMKLGLEVATGGLVALSYKRGV